MSIVWVRPRNVATLLALTWVSVVLAQGSAQKSAKGLVSCSVPAVLRITKVDNDYYQLDEAKAHKLFGLGEVSSALRGCPERTILVVAQSDVPIGTVMLPAKEQITNVRYFLQYKNGDATEISFGLSYPKLPTTPDVKGYPVYDDTPPTSIPKGTGKQ